MGKCATSLAQKDESEGVRWRAQPSLPLPITPGLSVGTGGERGGPGETLREASQAKLWVGPERSRQVITSWHSLGTRPRGWSAPCLGPFTCNLGRQAPFSGGLRSTIFSLSRGIQDVVARGRRHVLTGGGGGKESKFPSDGG